MAAVLLRFLRESRKVQSFGEPSPCVMDITRLYVYIFKGIKKMQRSMSPSQWKTLESEEEELAAGSAGKNPGENYL